jgi:hypothetical protein
MVFETPEGFSRMVFPAHPDIPMDNVPVPYQQQSNNCGTAAVSIAVHLAGHLELAEALHAEALIMEEALKHARKGGFTVQSANVWGKESGETMLVPANLMRLLVEDTETSSISPIAAVLLNIHNKPTHVVVLYKGRIFDPNNKFTVPLTQAYLDLCVEGGRCNGVKKGWRFVITAKALKRKHVPTELTENATKKARV